MSIRYLNHHEIDIKAWDNCIAGSFNASIYAFSWYLDLVCDTWNALVEDNYLSVMPLPAYPFLGKTVIDHPQHSGELGIFSVVPINHNKTQAFIEAIPPSFAYYRIVLNKYNPVNRQSHLTITRTRFELDLIQPYAKLSASYGLSLQQQLNTLASKSFGFVMGMSPNDLIRFITEHHIRLPKSITAHNYKHLRMLMAGLIQYKSGELFGLYDEHNELVSVALFNWINNQINLIFLVAGHTKFSGNAHLYLIDKFVEKYAETNTILVLDTMVKKLYPLPCSEFGARETNYVEIISNKLPFPLKLFI